jgi:hypothetical protein
VQTLKTQQLNKMKKIINNCTKGLKKAFCTMVIAAIIIISVISCGSSGSEPEIVIEEPIVTPVNELYKELDFTAIAAHRCYFRESPENSLAAIQDAIDLGVDFLETDTQTTADGVVLLFHDSTLDRVTNGSGLIANRNHSTIRNLKLKDTNGNQTDEPIATLEQALLKIKGVNIYIHIEVKDKNFSEVIKIVKRTKTENQVVIFADTRDDYNEIDAFVGIFADPVCRNSSDFNFYLNRSNTPLLNLAGSQFNSNNTLTAKNNKKLTWRGITNKPEDNELKNSNTNKPNLDAVLQVNPSIINTDYADLMIPYLISKNKR